MKFVSRKFKILRNLFKKHPLGNQATVLNIEITVKTGKRITIVDRYFYGAHTSRLLRHTDPDYDPEEAFLCRNYRNIFSLRLLCKWKVINAGIHYENCPPGLRNYIDIPIELHFRNISYQNEIHTIKI